MAADLIFFALFLAGLTLMGLALGPWMARVFTDRARLLAPVERALYCAAGVTGRGGFGAGASGLSPGPLPGTAPSILPVPGPRLSRDCEVATILRITGSSRSEQDLVA